MSIIYEYAWKYLANGLLPSIQVTNDNNICNNASVINLSTKASIEKYEGEYYILLLGSKVVKFVICM